ncbi:MAG: Wzz/FepE/Etk N-terminal domain-containing protein [Candidatus Babeliales bacterium]
MLSSPLESIFRKWKFILLVGIVIGILAGGLTFLFPMNYRADAQVLIISQSRSGVDPYTVVKSAERVGENIAEVMRTDDFFQKVKSQPGYTIDWSRFDKLNERDKRKLWNKTIAPSVVYGTGVLNVSAFDIKPDQAKQLAGASVDALSAKGWEYVGGDVQMKVVNSPVVTRWPVRPNVLVNVILGCIIGILGTAMVAARKN